MEKKENDSHLIGFSDKINDPKFDKYKKDTRSWSLIFSAILALTAMIAFPVYGKKSGEIEWPYSLYYGFGIGGMFILIALFQIISRNFDSTWDGVVVNKIIYNRKRYDKNNGEYTVSTVYEYHVKKDNGKIYKSMTDDDDTVYKYFNIGDRVRHHKWFGGYEKYDKSKDEIIFCTACSSLNNINDDTCFRCKCPLLK